MATGKVDASIIEQVSTLQQVATDMSDVHRTEIAAIRQVTYSKADRGEKLAKEAIDKVLNLAQKMRKHKSEASLSNKIKKLLKEVLKKKEEKTQP